MVKMLTWLMRGHIISNLWSLIFVISVYLVFARAQVYFSQNSVHSAYISMLFRMNLLYRSQTIYCLHKKSLSILTCG